MKIYLNCCTKPALFKGNEVSKKNVSDAQPDNKQAQTQTPAPKSQVQQPKVDTVEINGKKNEPKCEGPDCKCEGDACKK